tara:strand:- start:29 stop:559 length:531 start_codon:yes stop_codon:yes gene_type:complete
MININKFLLLYISAYIFILYFSFPNLLEANGRIEKYEIYQDQRHLINYGLYPEKIFTGPLHIALSIQNINTLKYLDAKVNINISGPNFTENIKAKKSFDSPLFYEYDTIMFNEGIYNLTIIIDTIEGNSEIRKIFTVHKGTNITNILIIFSTITLILIPLSLITRKYYLNKAIKTS